MKKKSFFTGLLSLFMLFGLLTPVSAETNSEVEEGLIPALPDAFISSESVLDAHLQEMGFSTTDLSNMPIDMKKEISSKDGKKVAAQELDTVVTVTDEEGNTVTDISVTAADATPTLSGYAVYSGTSNNGRELIYQVYATYNWNSSPFNFYTDNLAMAWQANATPTGTPGGQHSVDGGSGISTYVNHVDKEEVAGTSYKVDMKAGGTYTKQYGWGRQELRYPATADGTSTAIAVGYSHRILPGFTTGISLSFGYVGFSGNGKVDYTGRFTFVI
ncbi:hypothetical protein ACE3NQ_24065 [Paenibacillus terreus]|uniref:Uncharacterized protein n=1 Tax=Paenibacillus terreus TaxID=1387834 RepID=A0ABV5BEN3_9BACL